MYRLILEVAFFYLLFAIGNEVLACPQQCVPVLEAYESFEEQVVEIEQKYPNIQAVMQIARLTGHNPGTLGVEGLPELEQYLKEVEEAKEQWQKQMFETWTGPKSDNEQVMLKMFDSVTEECQYWCY